jgi:hypothetical protein
MLRGRSRFGAVVAGLTIMLMMAASVPASAGFFDFLFGRRQSSPPPQAAPDKPRDMPRESWRSGPRVSGGLGAPASYCVRLCDGRYFPIPRSTTAPPPAVCSALCPAASTKVFFGSDVARATASDGAKYDDLENAYVYRDKTIDGCSCNGRTPYGLASLDPHDDPTLRPGDLIATTAGVVRSDGARQALGQAGEDVTSSIGLRGQLDGPPPPPPPRYRRHGRSDFFSRHDASR